MKKLALLLVVASVLTFATGDVYGAAQGGADVVKCENRIDKMRTNWSKLENSGERKQQKRAEKLPQAYKMLDNAARAAEQGNGAECLRIIKTARNCVKYLQGC